MEETITPFEIVLGILIAFGYLTAWYIIGVISSILIIKIEYGVVKVKDFIEIKWAALFGLVLTIITILIGLHKLWKIIFSKINFKINFKIKYFDNDWLKSNGEKVIWVLVTLFNI